MALFRSSVLRRRSDGSYSCRLPEHNRELLVLLTEQLADMLQEDPDREEDDPSLRRLFPTAYPDDPFKDAEYQVIAGDELRKSQLEAIRVLGESAQKTVLTEDEVMAWVRSINAVRLVLGTRLDVSEDDEAFPLVMDDPDDPEAQTRVIYSFLSFLLEDLLAGIRL